MRFDFGLRSLARAPRRLVHLIIGSSVLVSAGGCDIFSPQEPSIAPAWSVPLAGAVGTGLFMPATDSSALYIVLRSDSTRLVKLDASTGRTLWAVWRPLLLVTPLKLLVRGNLILYAAPGGAMAFRRSDGAVRWSTPLARRRDDDPGTIPDADDAALYTADHAGAVTALDLESGAIRWRWEDTTSFASRPRYYALAAIDSSVYLVGSRQPGILRAAVIVVLDRVTGRERSRAVAEESDSEYISVRSDGRGGLLLGNSERSGVDNRDAVTLRLRWSVRRTRGDVFPTTDLALRDGVVYVGWQDVVAIDVATGRELWSQPSRGTTFSTVVCGDRVVTQHFNLSFFERSTGRLRAFNDYTDGQFPTSGLVEDGRHVYALSENRAYAFPCR